MRTGAEYREALRDGRKVVIMGGGAIDDVTTHPATAAMVEQYVAWYDRHFDPIWADTLLTPPDTAGNRQPWAYVLPTTSEHAIAIRLVECVDVVASQRRQFLPQMDQVAREAQMIAHRPIGTESPPRQQVRTVRQNVPGHLLEEFLAHEEVGNARRCQQQRAGDPAAGIRSPGLPVRAT